MNKSTNKKFVFYSSAIVAVLAIVGGITVGGISESNTQSENRPGAPLTAMTTEKNTILATADSVDFRVDTPKYLPDFVTFEKGLVSDSLDKVTLIYSPAEKSSSDDNITDRGIDATTDSVIYTISLQETNPLLYSHIQPNPIKVTTTDADGNISTKVIPQELSEFTETTVNGKYAVVETVDAEHGKNLPRLGWWEKGLLYTISADLSTDELVKIAESIKS